MYKKLLILMAVILILVGGYFLYKYKFSDKYTWYDNSLENTYQELTWQTGDFLPLAGIDAKYDAKEMKAEKCATEEELEKNDFVRVEGGMCRIPVKVFIKDENGKEKNIGDYKGLLSLLSKIDSPEKALSFVVLTTSDVERNEKSLAPMRSTKTEGGYLVEYTSGNTFGCGTHQPLKVIVLVTEDGSIKTMAVEKERPSIEPEMCVD